MAELTFAQWCARKRNRDLTDDALDRGLNMQQIGRDLGFAFELTRSANLPTRN